MTTPRRRQNPGLIRRALNVFVLAAVMVCAVPAAAQMRWLYVETAELPDECEILADCLDAPMSASRQLLRLNRTSVASFVQGLAERASIRDLPPRADAAPQCTAYSHGLSTQLERLEVTDKIGALRGLRGVYFDASSVKGPDGSVEAFGAVLHPKLAGTLRTAGLRILSKEEAERTPGHPRLLISFSARFDDRGCIRPFRASLQLKETVVLTRDPSIRIESTIWSKSVAQALTNSNRTPEIAMEETIEAFVTDWLSVNVLAEAGQGN